ncbi:MAG: signal peptide peptidase SppA [Chloroflexi bacterium]|nr:signal peptide peptidase SppA [Chloroflexota bacterium]
MKNRKTWSWIIGLSLVALLICGGFIGLGLWAASSFGGSDTGPLFGDAVAIVRVEGIILPGEAPAPNPFAADEGAAYSQRVIDDLKNADEDDGVKAIILFVDSPGGSAFASDEIAVQIKKMHKPIIAAMGSLAASGGYYVSAPTQEIWAGPQTLTCSIGVISQFLNLEGFAEEYGITAITVKSGKFKDSGNPFREFTEEDKVLWQAIIDDAFAQFVGIVAEGRNMSEEAVREIADGRVCTSKQAKEMGLVDNFGYLPDAIDRAAELGGIEGEPRLVEYKRPAGIFQALGSAFNRPSPVEELKQLLNYHAGSPLMYLYISP